MTSRLIVFLLISSYAVAGLLSVFSGNPYNKTIAMLSSSAIGMVVIVHMIIDRGAVIEKKAGKHTIRGYRSQIQKLNRLLKPNNPSINRSTFFRIYPTIVLFAMLGVLAGILPLYFFLFQADLRSIIILGSGALIHAIFVTILSCSRIVVCPGVFVINSRRDLAMYDVDSIDLATATISCDLWRGAVKISAPDNECLVEIGSYNRPYVLCSLLLRNAGVDSIDCH